MIYTLLECYLFSIDLPKLCVSSFHVIDIIEVF